MKNFKIILSISVLFFISNIGKAQYIERDEIKYFEGSWVAKISSSDSIIMEMNMKKKFPIKSDTWDTGVIMDVLLMNISYFKSGEKVYSPVDIEGKYRNQYFVAILVSPYGTNDAILEFSYKDDNNTTLGGIGKGKLRYIDGVLEMDIDNRRQGIILQLPDQDEKMKYNSKLSIPKQLTFKKKIE